MDTFLAYRLPFEETPLYAKGTARWLTNLDDCPEHGFILHSFLGDRILIVENLTTISPGTFKQSSIPLTDIESTKEGYEKNFEQLIQAIRAKEFKKVILSRVKTVPNNKSGTSLFNTLNQNYDNTFNYIVSNSEIGTWIGATPERLLVTESTKIMTMSLAGTKTALEKWTSKEFEEQALVTETITETLKKSDCTAINTSGPSTLKAGNVEHLLTKIEATLTNTETWKKVAFNLHPTPAVCGIPTIKAKKYIQKLEPHKRNFYTGFIGIITPESKSLFVNLRCMELGKGLAKLYLGGGITAPSQKDAEWLETERKAETLLQIIEKA